MATKQNDSKKKESQRVWEDTTQWMSRTIAVCLLMFAPGLLGFALDKRWGTSFLGVAGFVIGITLGTFMLLVLLKQFGPKAGGKPLSDDELDSEDK